MITSIFTILLKSILKSNLNLSLTSFDFIYSSHLLSTLSKPYSYSSLKQAEITSKYPTTAIAENVIYFTLNSYAYHQKFFNCIWLSNLKSDKNTMD